MLKEQAKNGQSAAKRPYGARFNEHNSDIPQISGMIVCSNPQISNIWKQRVGNDLVGTTDRWNNAKKAELRDRVKHA